MSSELSKFFERLLGVRLRYWLETNDKLPQGQYGFRAGRSCDSALMMAMGQVIDNRKHGQPPKQSIMACIDLSKAFDSVRIPQLMKIFEGMGIPSVFARFLVPFLTDRRYMVRYGSASSKSHRFFNGLPQGSVLGPLLWDIYLVGVSELVPTLAVTMEGHRDRTPVVGHAAPNPTLSEHYHKIIEIHMADDLNFLVSGGGGDLDEMLDRMQDCLNRVHAHLRSLFLTLADGPGKLKACLFSSRHVHRHVVRGKIHAELDPNGQRHEDYVPNLTIGGIELEWCSHFRLLGVELANNLTATVHVKNVIKNVKLRLCQLRSVAGSDWGMDSEQLRVTYIQYIGGVVPSVESNVETKIGDVSSRWSSNYHPMSHAYPD